MFVPLAPSSTAHLLSESEENIANFSVRDKPFSPDPVGGGQCAVSSTEYDFGDAICGYNRDEGLVCPPPTGGAIYAPVELTARVHYPRELASSTRKYPLIVMLHGGYATCYDMPGLWWPCSSPNHIIPSYRGFDYLGEVLASHGYIVVSISANGLKHADPTCDHEKSALARAQLLHQHLLLWKRFDRATAFQEEDGGFFSQRFQGRVDFDNIGLMGHSCGGAGVIEYAYHYGNILASEAKADNRPKQDAAFPVKALMALAPTNVNRRVINHLPLAIMLSYDDGDPAGKYLPGVYYFDAARYNTSCDMAAKHMILVLGANHNYYNSIWLDDDCRTKADRLTPVLQRQVGVAYITAFFRTYLGRESQFLPMLTGDAQPPNWLRFARDNIIVSYHAPTTSRLDINRFLKAENLDVNTLGGPVTRGPGDLLTSYYLCGGGGPGSVGNQQLWPKCLPDQSALTQPHWLAVPPAPGEVNPGLLQLRIAWKKRANDARIPWYETHLPEAYKDIRQFHRLQFRVGIDFRETSAPVSQNFTVVLVDGNGQHAPVPVQDYSNALSYPLGKQPKVLLNMVGMPLAAFENKNAHLQLENIQAIRFEFNTAPQGALFITDMALSK